MDRRCLRGGVFPAFALVNTDPDHTDRALGGDAPWSACGHLVATAIISVAATLLLKPRDLADL
ncbi:MAG: hypothetical protein U5N53_01665 [Mycobacterium sp.]|nr:hypothetical protein [Mycobacterium sp.]